MSRFTWALQIVGPVRDFGRLISIEPGLTWASCILVRPNMAVLFTTRVKAQEFAPTYEALTQHQLSPVKIV